MSQQGTMFMSKKIKRRKKKTWLDSQIILQKECKVYSAFFFSFSTSCKYQITEQFYTASLSLLAKCGGLVENYSIQ